MKDLKMSIGLICILGIYATGSIAYAEDQPDKKNHGVISSILSFFGINTEKKDVTTDILRLEKPTKENAGQYITLSESTGAESTGTESTGADSITAEPVATIAAKKSPKILTIRQSFDVKPSLLFNMGGLEPRGITLGGTSSDFFGLKENIAGSQVTFSYGAAGEVPNPHDLGISIGSQFLVEPSKIISPLYDASEFERAHRRQAYSLSMDMGYAGFNIGASFNQEKTLHSAGLKGFDIGLGYNSDKWGADIRFGEYKREHDRLFATTEEFYNTVYALGVGATYEIYSNIRFTGRFTYYSYGQENELEKIRSSQVFFLGTNVNF